MAEESSDSEAVDKPAVERFEVEQNTLATLRRRSGVGAISERLKPNLAAYRTGFAEAQPSALCQSLYFILYTLYS